MWIIRFLNFLKWEYKEYLAKNNKEIEEVYNEIAKEKYENTIKYSKRLQHMNVVFDLLPRSDYIILDLGCGTGVCMNGLLKKYKKMVGVDISEEMIKVAQKRFKDYPNIEFIKSDFLNLNFDNNKFDIITICNATRFIPSEYEEIFLERLKNWIKKDGYLIVFIIDSNFLYKLYSFIKKIIDIPKYTNVFMHFKQYFYNKAINYFVLQNSIKLFQVGLIKNYAIIFKLK